MIQLKPFDQRHLPKTLEWANNPEFTRLMDRAFPISDQEHEVWFSKLHEWKQSIIYFAIETSEGDHHIGNVWLWNIDWLHRKAEVSIVIGDADLRGKGAGTEAITCVASYAFERLNLHKIYAHVLAINPRARRAFEKAGFILEGTLLEDRWSGTNYVDVYLLARLAKF
jgi:RimJ/RimL family protein N-acetyltransferase